MASYLRTRLPHFRHAALSLHKTKILPCFHSSNDAAALLPPRTAYVRAFHDDDKQDEIDDDGTLDSMKGNPAVLVKKGDDGGVLEPHAVVEKVGVTNSKLDAADDGGAQDLHASKLLIERSGKSTKKRVPVVVSLCNATRVYDIVHFPPEVLQDNRRLRQLFQAWKKEWKVRYGSNAEDMDAFEHFKFNVARYDRENRKEGQEYRRLGPLSDYIPGYIPMRPIPCCWAAPRN